MMRAVSIKSEADELFNRMTGAFLATIVIVVPIDALAVAGMLFFTRTHGQPRGHAVTGRLSSLERMGRSATSHRQGF
jgi:hypothetical protein